MTMKGKLMGILAMAAMMDPLNPSAMELSEKIHKATKPEPVVITPQNKDDMLNWMKMNVSRLADTVNDWNDSCSVKLKEWTVESGEADVTLHGTTQKNADKRWRSMKGKCLRDSNTTFAQYLSRIDKIENPDNYKEEE